MIKVLQQKETISIAGGWRLPFGTNKMECMGDGRDQHVKCYDANGVATRGWMAKNWECAKWFCCSGAKGEYYHMVVGKEYHHCKTGAKKQLDASVPDDLAEHI